MADKFLDCDNGNDANSGEYGSPWRTYSAAALLAFMAAGAIGDRLICSGTWRATLATLNSQALPEISGRDGFVLMQHEGRAQHVIRCDAPIVGLSWTNISGNIWETTVPAGLGSPTGITVDYDVSTETVNGTVLNYGICNPVADDATVATTTWSFVYVSATGRLRVNVPGRNPNTSTITMVRQGNPVQLVVENSIEPVVQGIHFRLAGINQGGGGYGVYVDSCAGALVEGCQGWDHGAHTFVIAGTLNQDNVTRSCKGHACGANATQFVTYVNSATQHVTGNVYDSNVAHVVGYRNGENKEIFDVVSNGGYTGHADGGATIADCVYRRCGGYAYQPIGKRADGITDLTGWGFRPVYNMANAATFAGSWNTRTGRKLQYIDCWSRNDIGLGIDHAPYFLRCSFHFTSLGPSNAAASGGAMILLTGNSPTVRCFPLLDACELLVNLQRPSAGSERGVYALNGTYAAGEGIGMVGCSFINVGGGSNDCLLFDWNSKANLVVHVHGCLIGHANRSNSNTYYNGGDGSNSAADHDFRSNMYVRTNGGLFELSGNTSIDSWAEWNAGVDTAGVRVTDVTTVKFADLATSLQVLPGSVARASINPAERAATGINGVPFAGDYGCYQYGADAVGSRGLSVSMGISL